jgi:5-methylcytosine-specific restriction endonuclease McrA
MCGVEFATARQDQRFCGDRCGRRYHRRKSDQPWNDRRRANYQVRRARKKAAMNTEVILLDYLRKRDKDRCGICGTKISNQSYPHPLSASVDHIVPLSQGGTHEPANVQLTHLSCNVRKGVRGGGEQLMLYG